MQKLLAVLVLGLVVSSLCDGGNNGPQQQQDEQEDRDLSVSSQGDQNYEFQSVSKTNKNRLKFSINTNDEGLQIRVEYQAKSAAGEISGRNRVEVQEIIEYIENGTAAGYQPGEEVSVLDLTNKNQWNPISCVNVNTTYDCTVSTVDGQFSAVVHIVQNVAVVNGQNVRPSSVKIDFIIDLKSRQNNSRVALVLKSKSRSVQEMKNISDEEAQGFVKHNEKQISFGTDGSLSWAVTADIGGTAVNVINGNLSRVDNDHDLSAGENSMSLVFSFDSTLQGKIVWDPKLLWESTAQNVVNAGVMAFPSLLLMAVAAFVAMLKN